MNTNVYAALSVQRLHFFCSVVLLSCQLQFVIVSPVRVLIQKKAAFAFLPVAGGVVRGGDGPVDMSGAT